MFAENQPNETYVVFERTNPSHFTMIPNMLMDVLNATELYVYSQYARIAGSGDGGACWMSNANIEERMRLSINTIKKHRKSLQKHGLIRVEDRENNTTIVTIVDIWERNQNFFRASQNNSNDEGCQKLTGGVSKVDRGGCQKLTGGVSKVDTNKKPYNKNHNKNNHTTNNHHHQSITIIDNTQSNHPDTDQPVGGGGSGKQNGENIFSQNANPETHAHEQDAPKPTQPNATLAHESVSTVNDDFEKEKSSAKKEKFKIVDGLGANPIDNRESTDIPKSTVAQVNLWREQYGNDIIDALSQHIKSKRHTDGAINNPAGWVRTILRTKTIEQIKIEFGIEDKCYKKGELAGFFDSR